MAWPYPLCALIPAKARVPAPSPPSPSIQNLRCTNRPFANANTFASGPAFAPSTAPSSMGQHCPLLGTQGPTTPSPPPLQGQLSDKQVSSQTSRYPSKLLVVQLAWTTAWGIPSYSPLGFQNTYTPLPICFIVWQFYLYLPMSIMRTNVLSFFTFIDNLPQQVFWWVSFFKW